MTSESEVAREKKETSCVDRRYVRAEWNVLAAHNIRFETTALQRVALDPTLDETVVNPVWSRPRLAR